MKFAQWLESIISFDQAMELFGYKPGDFVDGNKLSSDYKKLMMQYHPDRNPGDRSAEQKSKEVNDAYTDLRAYIGKTLPGFATPKPTPSPTYHWADASLHAADRIVFGKWLHEKIYQTHDFFKKRMNPEEKINKLVDAIGEMSRAFAEWQNMHRDERTVLTRDSFNDMIDALDVSSMPGYTDEQDKKFAARAIKKAHNLFLNQFWRVYLDTFKGAA